MAITIAVIISIVLFYITYAGVTVVIIVCSIIDCGVTAGRKRTGRMRR